MTGAEHEATPLLGMHVAVRLGDGDTVQGQVTRIDGDDLIVTAFVEAARVPPDQWRQWLARMLVVKVTMPMEEL